MGSKETIIEAYRKIEREIIREEKAAPAPSLGHEMAKFDRFIVDIENLMSQLSQERIADIELTSSDQFFQKYFNPRCVIVTIKNNPYLLITYIHKYILIYQIFSYLFRIVDESDNAIRTVMAELRINLDQTLAIEHEEFIATLNRKVYTFDLFIDIN